MKPNLLTISGECAILNCPKCGVSSPFYISGKTRTICQNCLTEHDILTTFQDKLKAYKCMKYFDNKELAEHLEISNNTLNHWLLGRYSTSNTDVRRVIAVMKEGGIV